MSTSPQDRIDSVCDYRGVPRISINQPCVVDGKAGTIIDGNSSCNFDVLFVGWTGGSNCHPYWKMTILADDLCEVIYDSKDG
ncbi:MAG: hypothetical protein MJK15_03915 [Colwellia sp.]|nr:hypothetical protein [Colwellia sp.]